jgi:hypothetical protein
MNDAAVESEKARPTFPTVVTGRLAPPARLLYLPAFARRP